MSDSAENCSPCARDGAQQPGVAFCDDCEDPLCAACLTLHGKIKCLTSHVVRVVGPLDGLERGSCSDHRGWLLEHYCSRCGLLCCRECVAARHGQCGTSSVHLPGPLEILATPLGSHPTQATPSAEQRHAVNVELSKLDDSMKKLMSAINTNISESKEACKKATDVVESVSNFSDQCMKGFLELVAKTVDKKRDEIKQVYVNLHEEIVNMISELTKEFSLANSKKGKQSSYSLLRALQKTREYSARLEELLSLNDADAIEHDYETSLQKLRTMMEELCRLGDGKLEPIARGDFCDLAGDQLESHVTGMLVVAQHGRLVADRTNNTVHLIVCGQNGEFQRHTLPLLALFK